MFEQLTGRVERILCICARAGHEVLFAGASLHRLSTRGCRITVVALSSRSPTFPPQVRVVGLARAEAALAEAAAALGVFRSELLAMSSPPLLVAERLELQERLCQLIREERPDLVISEGLGVPAAAVDRQTGLALSSAAIAAAAAPEFGSHPKAATAPHEVPERWLFAPPSDVAIYRHRSQGENDRLVAQTWIAVDARSDLAAKWLALRAYVPDLAVHPTPELEELLGKERFLAIRYGASAELVVRRRRAARQN